MSSIRKRRLLRSPSFIEDDEGNDSGEEDFELRLPESYHNNIKNNQIESTTTGDGKSQMFYSDGHREILFDNGVKKEAWSDGYTVVYFTNGDIKQSFPAS